MITNGHKPTALLTYSVNDCDVLLLDSGDLLVDGHVLNQQQAYAVSVALKLPGMRATLNRIELTRQEATTIKLLRDDDLERR